MRSGLKSSCTRAEEKDLGVVEEVQQSGFKGLGLFKSDTETRRNLNHISVKLKLQFLYLSFTTTLQNIYHSKRSVITRHS